jgi:hypothetical protein
VNRSGGPEITVGEGELEESYVIRLLRKWHWTA